MNSSTNSDPGATAVARDVVPYPADIRDTYVASGAWTAETLPQRLHEEFLRRTDGVAVVTPERSLTFVELDQLSDRFGASLRGLGLRSGDRVLFQITNTADAVVAYYGTIKAGLVPVCSIPQLGERDMRMLAERARPRAYLFQRIIGSRALGRIAERVAETASDLDYLIGVGPGTGPGLSFDELVGAVSADEARRTIAGVEVSPADLAVLQLSGGTTGTPKLIPRLQCDYLCNATQWAAVAGWDADTVVLHAIPLLHNAGLSVALQPAHLSGATFVTLERPRADGVLDLVEQARVTVIPVTPPALLQDLLDAQQRRPRDISSLRHIIVAGQRLDRRLADRLEREFGVPCLQKFGMAEGMFLYTPPDGPEWVRKETVGSPISVLDEVRILSPGTETEVDEGEVGELCCRGPYTVRGYYADPERNVEAFTSDGFYRTGDLARSRAFKEGVVYAVEGRLKDTINRGGEKINAEDIESVILLHRAVKATAVVAMPDERLGERACAYVVVAENFRMPSLADIAAFCLDHGMAKFKLPERVEQIDALPLTNTGKVAKQALREDIKDRLASETASSSPREPPQV